MQVIKVVKTVQGKEKLVSTFAKGVWQKEYAEGVETKPDTGFLFAYSKRNLARALKDRGRINTQYWLAEAEVVGKVKDNDISVLDIRWQSFWKGLKLRLRNKGAEYLLCSSITLTSSITLVKRIDLEA